ncbi:hypothetical protein KFK09_025343 [Dendrobium nobile]|uniref:C3H1-type domain-containing protein n=1 Tax=Dendrobium nobile TaxID=94219 RepID=A0A8T3AGA0_DENNO|nr:hypothetical protein KFK09_025343 [Dendrobium nobile]
MDEKMKRRIPKWDVAAELHVDAVGHESALLEKVDDPCMNLTVVDSMNPIISMNLDGSDVNQSATQTGEEGNNNIIHSDDICEKTQISGQFDLEDDCKYGLKKQDWEPASQDRNIAEHTENQDKSHKAVYDMPLDPEERHQSTRNMSPVDDRRRLHRKRSRSRSLSRDSRSRSWSANRGKSPSYVSKQGSERWTDKGRMRGMNEACRAFAAGNCRRGNECRYLHEDGCLRQIDRHHDTGLTDGRGIRLERERQLVYGSNETLTDTEERNKYSRDKLSGMHEEHHEDGSSANIQHHGYRSNERCFDFISGRCFRGEACRYIHDDASSDGGWSVKDEFRGRVHDRRGESASFTRRIHHQRLSDIPCKYFLQGHCIHGEGCKFLHQLGPLNIPVDRSLDGSQHSFVSAGPAGNSTSTNASEQQHQTARFSSTNPRRENLRGVSDTQPIDKQNFSKRSLSQDGHKKPHSSEQQATTSEVCEELSVNNPLPTTLIACQNADRRGQNQSAPQILHAQNHFAPPIPSKGQMLQVMHSHYQNGKNQFAALEKPPDAHSFNANIQNRSANPSSHQLNPQNLDPRAQVQKSISILSHSGSNFNHNGQIQQNGPLILVSHSGLGQQDIAGDSQNILPQNVQNQVQNIPAYISNGQDNLVVVPQPPLNPQILNSDDKNRQLTMKNSSIQLPHDTDSSEIKPSQFNSDNSITQKVVTIEQAAKITDLSASLAQFFGSAAQNSQSSAAITPQPFLNPNSIASFATPIAPPLPTEVDTKQIDDKIEAHGTNGEAENGKDVDTKKIKEAKEIRLFKCALVEFVKDTLKPKWKEGQLSKEAYKTIVKKVVEKVCGSLQGPNVPQTQEKIDLYLLNCKAKLTKLVQAYVEKFVNS